MKIAALNPLFVSEVPEANEAAEARRAADRLREIQSEATAASSDADASMNDASEAPDEGAQNESAEVERETREGLRRLSDLLRDHRRKKEHPRFRAVANADQDANKQRAFDVYREASLRGLEFEMPRGRVLRRVA